MARNGYSPDILAVELQEWAVNEMKIRFDGWNTNGKQPSIQDLKKLCRGQQLMDVWRYVIDHVKSVQTVRKVDGNLKIHRQEQVTNRVNYIKMKALQEEISEQEKLRDDKKQKQTFLTTELEHLKQSLNTAESTVECKRQCLQSIGHRTQLLESFKNSQSQQTEFIEEKSRRLKLYQSTNIKRTEMKYYNRKSSKDSEDIVEDECTKQVRECCEQLESFLKLALKGNFGCSIEKLPKTNEQIEIRVKSVVDEFPSDQVVMSLVNNTDLSQQLLQRHTLTTDLTSDSVEPMKNSLQDWQILHIKSFMEVLKNRNEAAKLRKQLNITLNLVKGLLAERVGMFDVVHQLERNVLEADIQLYGAQAKLQCLQIIAGQLESVKKNHDDNLKALAKKEKQISSFKDITECNQNQISTLVKDMKTKLENNTKLPLITQKFVECELCDHHEKVDELVNDLIGYSLKELQLFKQVGLPELLFTVKDGGKKIRQAKLSINLLKEKSVSSNIVNQVLWSVNLDTNMSSEDILSSIINIARETEELSDHHDKLLHKNAADQQYGSKLEDLYVQSKEADRKLEQKAIVLHNVLQQTYISIDDCKHVQNITAQWWEQPGQYTAPWLVRGGHTFKQWKDMWTVAVTKLRQAAD